MIKESIILAGGLGTRLRSEVANLPKCMAPVAGKPFIHWVITNLVAQQVQRIIFSVGYMHQVVQDYVSNTYPNLSFFFSVEDKPLGTGGAILHALPLCTEPNVLVVNGDTLFEINNNDLYNLHTGTDAACTLALKPMQHFDRYGAVSINSEQQIISFEEKKMMENGLINGGVYYLNKKIFCEQQLPTHFSFEKDFLQAKVQQLKMMAIINDGYFIDIGIPDDFKKANQQIQFKYGDKLS